jgi:predicted permease
LRATRIGAGEVLKTSPATGGAGRRLGWVNHGLVVSQLTISSVLLIVTGVMINAAWTASRPALPFDAASTASFQVRLSAARYAAPEVRAAFFRELQTRLQALPGVTHATVSDRYPVERGNVYLLAEIEGRGPIDLVAMSDRVAEGFFRDFGVVIREGREFGAADVAGAERVTVINESFAREAWPAESPLGQRIRHVRETNPGPWHTVVGVVADLESDRSSRASAYFHLPIAQDPPAEAIAFVRTATPLASLIRPLQEVVRQLDPDVPIDRIIPLRDRLAEKYGPLAAFSMLALMLGAAALVLAAVGIYSVATHGVLRRWREFGIRTALGARPGDILGAVLKPAVRQLTLGLGVGLLLGWAAGQPLQRTVSGTPLLLGGIVYLVIVGLLVVTVGLAVWLPARRAAKVDPMVALRSE